MLNSGRSLIDYKLNKSVGNLPYTSLIAFVPRGVCNSTKWELLSNNDYIRELPYYYQSTPSTVYLASTDSNDNIAGTGARVVTVAGLDSNYDIVFDTVNLNGQTAVETTVVFSRVLEILIIAYGSNTDSDTGDPVPHGAIWCGTGTFTAGVPVNKMICVNGGGLYYNDGDSREGIFTIPKGKLGIFRGFTITVNVEQPAVSGRNGIVIQICVRPPGFDFFFHYSPFLVEDKLVFEPEHVSVIPSQSDIQVRVLGFNTTEKKVVIESTIELVNLE
jgi:hypothetical protein